MMEMVPTAGVHCVRKEDLLLSPGKGRNRISSLVRFVCLFRLFFICFCVPPIINSF